MTGSDRESPTQTHTTQAPAAQMQASTTQMHPLERVWAIWISGGQKLPDRGGSGGGKRRGASTDRGPMELRRIGEFGTIEDLWRWLNNLPRPSELAVDANLFIFQDDVDPAWEHPANKAGGRWVNSSTSIPDNAWRDLCLGLFGETLDAQREVTGLVLSRRRAYVRVSIWTRNKTKKDELLGIGHAAKAALRVKKLEYQDHGASYDVGSRYTI
jgi:hypothetical protein